MNLTISDIRRTLGIYAEQPITIINGGGGPTAVQTITPAATVNFDAGLGSWGTMDINTNVTTFNFTNLTAGASGLIYVFQTAGGNTITWGTMVNEVPSSGISLLTGAGELTIISWSSADGVVADIYVQGVVGQGGGSVDWTQITGKPSTFAPSAHAHPISDVTSLQAALDGKAATSHTHTKAQITDFAHTHAIAEVTGLQAALDAKQATLVSGTNIKTVNGFSILGSGNLVVAGAKVTINSAVDVSYPLAIGDYVKRVVVTPSSNLAAFTIGTSNGGTDISEATSLLSTESMPIPIEKYLVSGQTTLYFGGITSSTTIVIYYE